MPIHIVSHSYIVPHRKGTYRVVALHTLPASHEEKAVQASDALRRIWEGPALPRPGVKLTKNDFEREAAKAARDLDQLNLPERAYYIAPASRQPTVSPGDRLTEERVRKLRHLKGHFLEAYLNHAGMSHP